jgi:putative glutamine amidotransferase
LASPLIGVTTRRTNNPNFKAPQFSVNQAYITSLVNVGALPVLIPLGLPDAMLKELVACLDGILFTGGGDIHPQRYGSSSHPAVSEIDEDRDRVEIQLLKDTLQAERPFFGVCRGLQVINVALGGSLYEDIRDQYSDSINHRCYPDWPPDYLAHSISIDQGSYIADILGGRSMQVNSLHHQGIKKLASGLLATAHAPDGLIEAFELPGYPFGLAVQWHPEWLQAQPPMRDLFQAFVQSVGMERKIDQVS